MHRFIVGILAVLLLAASAASGLLWREASQRSRQATAAVDQVTALRKKGSAMHDSLSWLRTEVNSYRGLSSYWAEEWKNANDARSVFLTLADISQIEDKGLTDPPDRLRRDLLAHPELIPFKGHDSPLQFDPHSIALLSDKWAFAKFDDGLIGGSCLLSYEVGPGGHISWKIVAATMD